MTCYKVLVVIFEVFLCASITLSYSSHYHGNRNWRETSKNVSIKSKVKISVYYETLCPASVEFFLAQLQPTVESLAPYLDLHLIPYGHALTRKISEHYVFRCQHGPAECYGNKLHACTINAFQGDVKSVHLIACLMQYTVYTEAGYNFDSAVNWCAYKFNENLNGVRKCVNHDQGSILLMKYGEETHRLNPRYVPYVLLDDSTRDQEGATSDLMATVCQKLNPSPEACRIFRSHSRFRY